MFKKQLELCDMVKVSIRGWGHGGHKGMDMVRNNAQVGRGV